MQKGQKKLKMSKDARIRNLEGALQILLQKYNSGAGGIAINQYSLAAMGRNEVEIIKSGDNLVFTVVEKAVTDSMVTISKPVQDELHVPSDKPVPYVDEAALKAYAEEEPQGAEQFGKSEPAVGNGYTYDSKLDAKPNFNQMAYVIGICEFYGLPYPDVNNYTRRDMDIFMDKWKEKHRQEHKATAENYEFNKTCRDTAIEFLRKVDYR